MRARDPATSDRSHRRRTPMPARPPRRSPSELHPLLRMQSRIGNAETARLLSAKLGVGRSDDPLERQADRAADRVMSMSGGTTATPALDAPASGRGDPLPGALRSLFEPRFGRDFSGVRIHTDADAANSARAIGAEAYAVGRDVVFGAGRYRPSTFEGQKLIAHELAHVAQGDAGASAGAVVRRKATVGASCAGHDDEITAAWDEAVTLVDQTIATLESMLEFMRGGDAPSSVMRRAARMVMNTFGDVGGLDGGTFTRLGAVIERFERIKRGFATGRTIRCDPESLGAELAEEMCRFHTAFVVEGDSTNIFLCGLFLEADRSQTSRAITLIHEMAHSALGADHEGLREGEFPNTAFDCNASMGIDTDQALNNAFAYGDLVNCLHGERPEGEEVSVAPSSKPAAKPLDLRWTASALGGIELEAVEGLAGLASRVSLRTGSAVVFNPTLGLQVLYSPRTDAEPDELFYALFDAGLRIQQPVKGVFVDLNAGVYGGFAATMGGDRERTGGFALGGGVGWRAERWEAGVDARALLPVGGDDPSRVVIVGRFGWRFGK